MDSRLEPVPIGVPGELALGGDGVARGYLGRPVQTAAVVVGHPAGGEAESAALTAYVMTREGEAVDDLRAWLVERLPEYMLPA